MKIGVIGTIVKDHIYLANGKEVRSYGGIYYTLSILGNLLRAEDQIYPVCFLGKDLYDDVLTRLSQYKNIKTSTIEKITQKNTTVKLLYKNLESRDEFITHLMPPIEFDHIQKIEGIDIWLINFITGFEISLDTINKFCEQGSGIIYVDFHSLSLDINQKGQRIPRKLPNWGQWIRGIDVLQMNDAEAAILNESTNLSHEELIKFGRDVIKKNIKIFHITRGSKGSLLFYQDNQGVHDVEFPAKEVDEVIDVTGCGDAFAAGFLVHYCNHKDIIAATRYANSIAGVNCTVRGTEELYKLKKFLMKGK